MGLATYHQPRRRAPSVRELLGITRFVSASLLALLILSFVGPNMPLTLFSVVVLAAIWFRAFRSPYRVIVACFLSVQWLQASLKAWMGNALGVSLWDPGNFPILDSRSFFFVYEGAPQAVALGLIALLVFHIGARLTEPAWQSFRSELTLDPVVQLVCYSVLEVVATGSGPFVGGGLAQPLIALGQLKYVFVVTLVYTCLSGGRPSRRALLPLGLVVLYEVGSGFLGFFSDFKTVLIVSAVAGVVFSNRANGKAKAALLALPAVALLLAVVWTGIKSEYRELLNQGTRQQAVLVGFDQKLSGLETVMSSLGPDELLDAVFNLASRVGYTDFLGVVIQRVPAVLPHEGGKLWGEAIAPIFMPRFLFPDKPPLPSDSERTMLYTGIHMASGAEGTSISMGWVAESYIDFGPIGVLIVALLMGLGVGLAVRLLRWRNVTGDDVLLVGTLIVALSIFQQFETSNVKVIPGFIWRVGMALFALSVIFPAILRRGRLVPNTHRNVASD